MHKLEFQDLNKEEIVDILTKLSQLRVSELWFLKRMCKNPNEPGYGSFKEDLKKAGLLDHIQQLPVLVRWVTLAVVDGDGLEDISLSKIAKEAISKKNITAILSMMHRKEILNILQPAQ